MHRSLVTLCGLALCCAGAFAQAPKVPLQSGEKGTLYVEPNLSPTETSMESKGATVGVKRPDGSGAYTGVDKSGERPTYSVGGNTGGNVSFSAGVESDGAERKGVKAGIEIKY
ncbi:MAG: hypothetical protein EOP81_09090 [Variovorax sp.]|nr:MAG: hypothetical protein EOP81_09090 [Variovorax sp.]